MPKTIIKITDIFANDEMMNSFMEEIIILATISKMPEEYLSVAPHIYIHRLLEFVHHYADEIEKLQKIRDAQTEKQIDLNKEILISLHALPKLYFESLLNEQDDEEEKL